MTILFGHPSGNPNSHHAALAHFESGRLEAFCVPWLPSAMTLRCMSAIFPKRKGLIQRFARRYFAPLVTAPKVQGRAGELRRLLTRAMGRGDERLSYEANDWLMHTMHRECQRPAVTAVHSYEDCSLWQFEEAKRLGKVCIYDLPIGYYPAWVQKQQKLVRQFAAWLPPGGLPSSRYVRPEQKRREMELADTVLVPSNFVRQTVERYIDKTIALAPYGVDLNFWHAKPIARRDEPMRFIFVGQCNLRKGVPVLLDAWKRADLKDSTLDLVGAWQFTEEKRRELPANVSISGPVSVEELRACYQRSDVFVFPSFFEGFSLVILEAMACGLPVIASDATGAPDVLTDDCGRIFPAGGVESLVDLLMWFESHRDAIPAMRRAARAAAERHSWANYRKFVNAAVAQYA